MVHTIDDLNTVTADNDVNESSVYQWITDTGAVKDARARLSS